MARSERISERPRADRRARPRRVDHESIVIFGLTSGSKLAARIRRAFGAGVVCRAEWLDEPAPGFTVAVCLRGFEHAAAQALAHGVPCLGVDFQNGASFLGPLALPARAGCLACARARLRAASFRLEEDDDQADESMALAGPLLVREIREVLRNGPEASPLIDHILAIDTHACTSSFHRVIPLARCTVCGGASVYPRVAEVSTATDVMQQLAGLLDFRTGIVSRLVIEPEEETGVALPIVATAAPPHVVEPNGSLRRMPLGWGKGLDLSSAILSAVGEAVERYAPSLPEPERMVWLRAADLDGTSAVTVRFHSVANPLPHGRGSDRSRDREGAVSVNSTTSHGRRLSLELAPLYAEEQYKRPGFPYARPSPQAVQPWVLGHWLDSGEPVWVPAIVAYLALRLQPEQLIAQGTSNGLASHPNAEEAALRATLELVERDAFLASWLTGTSGTHIEMDDSLDPALRTVLEGVERLGAQVELYRLETAACGTAVLCLALGDGVEYPGATIALGADLDPDFAVRQAILELGQTGPHLRKMMRRGALAVPREAKDVREMTDHAAWYFDAARASAFDYLRGGETVTLRALHDRRCERSLAACGEALTRVGVRVALVDVTSSDIATTGLCVMRAVSPDLQPLWYGHGLERRPVPRIERLGVRANLPEIHPIW